ncbi:hypothetical protein [Burkholderia ubonensis]|uniref:hypothetical protein n=1 Tax=Burkholderia ubonensis TaxID=101571 RepID=UPI0012F75051|nr:hypothetical protein [Burkholderia ubonensis]
MRSFSVQTIFANDRPLAMAGMEFIACSTSAIDLVGVSRSPVDLIASVFRQNCDVVLID